MPNKRSDGKFFVGAYLDDRLVAGIETWCDRHDLGRTDFLIDAAYEKLRREGIIMPREATRTARKRKRPGGAAFESVFIEPETKYRVSSGTGRSGDSDEALADRIVAEGEAAATRKPRRSSPEPTPGDAPAPTAPIGGGSPRPKRRNA